MSNGKHVNLFESGNEDTFHIEAKNIGEIAKIRIGHDNSGTRPGWYVEKVRIRVPKKTHQKEVSGNGVGTSKPLDDDDYETYWFDINQWFSKDEGDGQIVRFLEPTNFKGEKAPTPTVTVKPGNDHGHGSTSVPKTTPQETIIPADYEVHVFTGDALGAGTDADVFVNIFGESGESGLVQLHESLNDRKNKFERNQEDVFLLKTDRHLGATLKKLQVKTECSGMGEDWFLSHIDIVDKTTGRKWFFESHDWFIAGKNKSVSKDLVALPLDQKEKTMSSRTVASAKPTLDKNFAKTYNVDVVTGDVFGAGTDASVFIVLFGTIGQTEELWLKNFSTHKNKFEAGQTDRFELKLVDIGELTKIKIGHDDTGLGSDWFLDHVTIEAPSLTRRWLFPCKQWLSKSKGDKKLTRELFPDQKFGATDPVAPTNNNGNQVGTHSAEKQFLELDNSKTSKVEERKVPSAPPSPVPSKDQKKDPHLPKQDLEPVRMEEQKPHQKAVNFSPIEKVYKARIFTGDAPGAGTDANVFACFYGPSSDTGEQKLSSSQHLNKFERGQMDEFEIKSLDIGMPNKCRIRHDNSSLFSSPWFVDHVELVDMAERKVHRFPCRRWLSMKHDDKRVERTLQKEMTYRFSTAEQKVQYEMTFATGDIPGAGTTSNVVFTLFGEAGASTGEVTVDKTGEKFEKSAKTVVLLESEDIGARFTRLHVSHTNSGARPDWYLDYVDVVNLTNKLSQARFRCDNWLSSQKGDKKLAYDLPAGPIPPKHVDASKRVIYKFSVKTNQQAGSGTTANVSVILFGQKAHSPEIALKSPETGAKPFEAGKEDIFTVSNIDEDLGELMKLRIWHDNSGAHPSWRLDYVRIFDTVAKRWYDFPCNQWLSNTDGDKQIIRDLQCSNAANTSKPHTISSSSTSSSIGQSSSTTKATSSNVTNLK